MPRNRATPCTSLQHAAHEAFTVTAFALSGLRRHGPAPAAQCRACDDLDLPAHVVAAGRLQLPSSADLFGLWRRGDRAVRAVGRRMDDASAVITLPTLGHLGDRQCAADPTAGRAMVFAVAVRAMARRQCALRCARLDRCTAKRDTHCCRSGNRGVTAALIWYLRGEGKSMRWKISHRGHDPRQIDLIAIFALLILIVAACRFFGGGSEAPSTTAFIDPSQTVRW